MSRKTLAVALLVAVLSALAAYGRPSRPEPVEPAAASSSAGPPAVELLRAWDERRAEAWARGDPGLLRPLYTHGSLAGRHDRAMLRAWVARGLVVQGLDTQLLSVRELAHTATSWTLEVTDRIAAGVAVGRDGRRPLPHDQATTRTVSLRRVDGEWRVAAVRPVG